MRRCEECGERIRWWHGKIEDPYRVGVWWHLPSIFYRGCR